MPRPVLQVVAGVLGLCALAAFALGIINAPEHGGRLPGERPAGQAGAPGAVINAAEATPLSQERIEGPAPTAEKPAANKTDDEDQDTADQATNTLPVPPITPPAKPGGATNATPAQDRVGDLIQQATPPPEEPPH
ncbi:relaxase family protein [Phenylobacterium soli]|nr:hypothetical protein [Phenylobacterium soli]